MTEDSKGRGYSTEIGERLENEIVQKFKEVMNDVLKEMDKRFREEKEKGKELSSEYGMALLHDCYNAVTRQIFVIVLGWARMAPVPYAASRALEDIGTLVIARAVQMEEDRAKKGEGNGQTNFSTH